jgi:hypothetical protein
MSARQPGPYDDVARKWHALAVRRQMHVEELRDSGRWRHYYDWAELIEALLEATATRETWARLAGLAQDQMQVAIPGGMRDHSNNESPDRSAATAAADTADDWLDAELFRKTG